MTCTISLDEIKTELSADQIISIAPCKVRTTYSVNVNKEYWTSSGALNNYINVFNVGGSGANFVESSLVVLYR